MKHQYAIGTATGTGRTKTEARENAEAKATEYLTGDYSPFVYVGFGATLIVWRDPFCGWGYRIVHPGDAIPNRITSCGGKPNQTREKEIRGAMAHLLDLYWDRDPGTYPAQAHPDDMADILHKDSLRKAMQ